MLPLANEFFSVPLRDFSARSFRRNSNVRHYAHWSSLPFVAIPPFRRVKASVGTDYFMDIWTCKCLIVICWSKYYPSDSSFLDHKYGVFCYPPRRTSFWLKQDSRDLCCIKLYFPSSVKRLYSRTWDNQNKTYILKRAIFSDGSGSHWRNFIRKYLGIF